MGNFQIQKIVDYGIDGFTVALSVASAVNPILSPIGTLIGYVNNIYAEQRLNRLIEKLNEEKLDIDTIKDKDDFIFNSLAVFNAAARSRLFKKVDIFANLLINGIKTNEIVDEADTFEKNIVLLESLNIEDIEILEILRDNPVDFDSENSEEDFSAKTARMTEVINKIAEEINKTAEYVSSTLNRLSGLGFCDKTFYTQPAWGMIESYIKYSTSLLYEELRISIIKIKK
jgi:hypothetical protein